MSGMVEQIWSPLGRLDVCVVAAMVALALSSESRRGMSGVTESRARLFYVHWRPEKPALPLLKLPYGHTLREESNGPLHSHRAGCEVEERGLCSQQTRDVRETFRSCLYNVRQFRTTFGSLLDVQIWFNIWTSDGDPFCTSLDVQNWFNIWTSH